MRLISKKRHEQLMRCCERALSKNEDNLLKAKIPVSVPVLLEIKMSVPEEAKKAYEEAEKEPLRKGESRDVVAVVKLSEYATKLKAYEPRPAVSTPSA